MIRIAALVASIFCLPLVAGAAAVDQREVKTPYYSLALTPDGSAVASLSLDSLGKGEFRPSALFVPDAKAPAQTTSTTVSGYTAPSTPKWQFTFSERSFQCINVYSQDTPGQPMVLRFNPEVSHATLLSFVDGGQARLPALLHLPEQGSLRIEVESRHPVMLAYDAHRRGNAYVEIAFPGATLENPRVVYTFTAVAIYPHIANIDSDPRFDGFRRDYLNIFQMQAEDAVLANNSASDPCGFVQHMYSEVARYAPPLANGLTAMDVVRASLDKYLAGALACGFPYYHAFDANGVGRNDRNTISADTYPSLLIAAGDYIETTHDMAWLEKNYSGLREWAEAMLATDINHDGLIKYGLSGNSGSWVPRPDGGVNLRPANWWDTIGFGYEDAYSNALAYHALEKMAKLAELAKHAGDARRYRERASKLKSAYVPAFFNSSTGILAGWRSEDGRLHDYYFPWVNGAAVVYGLVPEKLGNSIFDRLLSKMTEVGYTNFEHGIPGNLVPIRREDYADLHRSAGGPSQEDGSDGFQIYENGSATAAFSYYTIAALYRLGRTEDGDRILLPMLKSYKNGGFEGRGPNGKTYDWQAWDGTPSGYEGFLADCFMTLAVVAERPASSTSTKH